MKKKRNPLEKKHIQAWKVTIFTLVVLLITCVLAYEQVMKYEDGVLDVYATQQDAYVQLVLDQINLVKNRKDDEIVSNILATLDASSNQYWTLASDDSLVFVKDVLETNKYQGYSTKAYYSQGTAADFLESLTTNRVTHSKITLNGATYVASGVCFEYSGKPYTICLMTNATVVIDHNAYLNAKINVIILTILSLTIFALMLIYLTVNEEHWYRLALSESEELVALRTTLENMNDRISREDVFDSKFMVFKKAAIPSMIAKLDDRSDAYPVILGLISTDTKADLDEFLENALTLFDKRTLRFIMNDTTVLLVMVKADENHYRMALEGTGVKQVKQIGYTYVRECSFRSLNEDIDKMLREAGINE